MTRRTLWDVVRDALGRSNDTQNNTKRTRITRARFERDHNSQVVHPERELSEWVRPKLERPDIPRKAAKEWDAIVRGEYREK